MVKVRILTGVYKDLWGFECRVVWRGAVRTRRYPIGTAARTMQSWREATRAEMEDADPPGPPQSFREAARRYLRSAAFAELASQKDRARDVGRWTDRFGDTAVALIHAPECQQLVRAWRAEGSSASTINHRIDALVAVLPRLRSQLVREQAPDPVPRVVPRSRIIRVLESLNPCATTTRLWWLFWTGMRPSQLRRLGLADVDFDGAVVHVPGGKAGRPYVVPLSPEAVRQLRPITSAATFESMSNGSANRVLLRACLACGVPRFSLYALRRSFGSTLRSSGVDLSDVQHLMGHRRIETTAIYAPILEDKLRKAVASLLVTTTRDHLPWGD